MSPVVQTTGPAYLTSCLTWTEWVALSSITSLRQVKWSTALPASFTSLLHLPSPNSHLPIPKSLQRGWQLWMEWALKYAQCKIRKHLSNIYQSPLISRRWRYRRLFGDGRCRIKERCAALRRITTSMQWLWWAWNTVDIGWMCIEDL